MKEFSEIGGVKSNRFSKKQHHRYFECNYGSLECSLENGLANTTTESKKR